MRNFGDLLYWLQVVLAIAFGILQAHHMLVYSTEGLSTSMFTFTGVFLGINLYLALSDHAQKRSRESFQTVVIYAIGCLVYGSFLAVLAIKAESRWDDQDTLTAFFVFIIIAIAFLTAKLARISVLDPIMKGVYSLGFKAIPQVIMSWKILLVGGSGLSVSMIIIFHVLTLSRVFQIIRVAHIAKTWNKNLIGLAISEVGNETSWMLVTLAWIIR